MCNCSSILSNKLFTSLSINLYCIFFSLFFFFSSHSSWPFVPPTILQYQYPMV